MTTLILPGLGGSGPGHWQSLWEKQNLAYFRVQQRDWDHPVREEWVANLEQAVAQAGPNTVLVAHSLGCLTAVFWGLTTGLPIKGALLVAPPNTEAADCPDVVIGYTPIPKKPLPFHSIVVASSNDPHGSLEFANSCAAAWGSELVEVGPLGHINAQSGIGEWREGLTLLQQLEHR